jgi:hypothetical protein
MSDFYVGQKVVYVGMDKSMLPDGIKMKGRREVGDTLTKNQACEIRWVGVFRFAVRASIIDLPACRIVGVKRNTQHLTNLSDITFDIPWAQICFRPIEFKAIEIFRKIARDVTEGREAEIVA